ncbi:hypothetical protein HMPREF1531_02037 [Propionibacterium sp. oral taxon 192 str. F0372]|uniref:hypothetical protein n=1 Tax=Propionibacterium sp. oral taxon 192 TaxID=671222 RepID=UPI0003535549|nr:hypothetical protein [Propionibacterium sp. oral taxon 192]EPH02726.1 hypothetical protein HMPREF1531_02037 [Propionibacterium sp. oral taxon 192 str. F0372]
MSDYAVEFDAAMAMSAQHAESRDALDAFGASAPTDVDGGDGTAYLLSMLAGINRDTGALVDILNTAAHQMAVTVDLYRGVEEEAEQVFRDLGDQI